MKLKPGAITEANVQFNLAFVLRERGFNVRVEVVPQGHNDCRFDVVILDRSGDIAAVVEMKNAVGYKACVNREKLLKKEDQGQRYKTLADKYGFKLFYCGGQERIQGCVQEITSAFPWWYRLWKGI